MKNKLGIIFYRILSRAYFYLPFLLIILYSKGYSIIGIELLMSCYGIGTFVSSTFIKRYISSIPSKRLLILSEVVKLIGLGLLSLSDSTILIVIAQLCLGASYSIGAGEDTNLIQYFLDSEATDFQNRTNGYMFISLLFSGIIGGTLYKLNPNYPIYATIIATIINTILLSLLVPLDYKKEQREFRNTTKYHLTNFEKYWVGHYVFLRGIILGLFTGFLPFYFFTDLHISTQYFVLILASYTLMGNISSKFFVNKNRYFSSVLLFPSLLLFLTNNIICICLGMVLLGLSSGITRPQTIKMLKESNSKLSIVLKIAEVYYACFNIIFLMLGGLLYLNFNFEGVICMSLIALAIYCIFSFIILKGEKNEN